MFLLQLYPVDVGELAEFGDDKLATLLRDVGIDKLNSGGKLRMALVLEVETKQVWCHLNQS